MNTQQLIQSNNSNEVELKDETLKYTSQNLTIKIDVSNNMLQVAFKFIGCGDVRGGSIPFGDPKDRLVFLINQMSFGLKSETQIQVSKKGLEWLYNQDCYKKIFNSKHNIETLYPQPNKNGVYDSDLAEKISYEGKNLFIQIFTLQISEKEWLSGADYLFKTGNCEASFRGLNNKKYNDRYSSIMFQIETLKNQMEEIITDSENGGLISKLQISEAKKALKWLNDKEKDLEFEKLIKVEQEATSKKASEVIPTQFNFLDELNQDEKEELKACEIIIENHLQSFLEVGEALIKIKENKLYRAGFKTFEEYCQITWNFTSRYARNLIQSAEIIEELKSGTIVPKILPETESQARELAKVEKNKRADAWGKVQQAIESGEKLTASLVQEKAEEYISDAKITSDKKTPGLNKSITPEIEQIPIELNLVDEIEIIDKKTEVEQIVLPVHSSKIIDVPKKFTDPKLQINNLLIDTALKTLTLSIADFAVQDDKSGPYIPAKNQTNENISLAGRGILNLLHDDNFNKYIDIVYEAYQEKGDIIEMIIFCKADFTNPWFKVLSGYSSVFCALDINTPTPIFAFYFGLWNTSFIKHFEKLGRLLSVYAIPEPN